MKTCIASLVLFVTSVALLVSATAYGFDAVAGDEFSRIACEIESGVRDGHGGEEFVAFTETLVVKNARSMRVFFDDWNLGPASRIRLVSTEDGAEQNFNAESLKNYGGASAYFNGDAVRVELIVAGEDKGVFFKIGTIGAGAGRDPVAQRTLCLEDDRSLVVDRGVGRVVIDDLVYGTAFIVMNGTLFTAGHVPTGMDTVVEFWCPISHDDGTIRHPSPSLQYPVDGLSRKSGRGAAEGYQDWGIFECFANSETGLFPINGERNFYRITYNSVAFVPIVRVSGYGDDTTPAGSGPDGENIYNHVLQLGLGAYLGRESGIDPGNSRRGTKVYYNADTTGGSSGSPVCQGGAVQDHVALAIHTTGYCGYPDDGDVNWGTGFDNTWLWDALALYHPAPYEMLFVDRGHPSGTESGSIWNPLRTMTMIPMLINPDGTAVIAGGSYGTPNGQPWTLNEPMTFRAVGGTVTISP